MTSHHEPMRGFTTTGPVVSSKHYCIPPLERLDLDDVIGLIRDEKYFILHAPRQTGKTSALLALRDLLNGGTCGDYRCVYTSFEAAQGIRENLTEAIRAILAEIASTARETLDDDFVTRNWRSTLEFVGSRSALKEILQQWAKANPRPLVLLIDEIDALSGETLLSVLRQLRSRYYLRPKAFPQSIVLCGVRNLPDYRIGSGSAASPGPSPFNIIAKSLRLGDFRKVEVEALLQQHTDETGQPILPDAVEWVWQQTLGQPWLVNALCNQACFENRSGRDRSRAITRQNIVDAQEALILQRAVHIDHLAERLKEARVRRVIEPLLSGSEQGRFTARDVQYVRDLGLIASDGAIRIANPVYREIIPREITTDTQEYLQHETAWYVDAEGGLDVPGLLLACQRFFRQHSEHWIDRYDYKEAGPPLLLQAFLQRIVNGGGRIEREYGLGRLRADLAIHWPTGDREQCFVVECKLLRGDLERVIQQGVGQTAQYMDRCEADAGHLVLFDRSERTWEEKLFRRRVTADGNSVEVWGM